MNTELDTAVRQRANQRCEYCRMPQSARRLRFQIDHIIARQHGGRSELENLALACGRCNRHKGPNIAGIDPMTQRTVALFNPRIDQWSDHFRFDGSEIVGLTPTGRATVVVMNINDDNERAVREELLEDGLM